MGVDGDLLSLLEELGMQRGQPEAATMIYGPKDATPKQRQEHAPSPRPGWTV